MKRIFLAILYVLVINPSDLLSQETSDKIKYYNDTAFELINSNPVNSSIYADSALQLNSIDSTSYAEFSKTFTVLGILNKNKGYHQIAITKYLKALRFANEANDKKRISVCYNNIGVVYSIIGNQEEAVNYYRESIKIEEKTKNFAQLSIRYYNLAESYQKLNIKDSARFYFHLSLNLEQKISNLEGEIYAYYGLSNLYYQYNNYDSTNYYITKIEKNFDKIDDTELICKYNLLKAKIKLIDNNDNTELYANKALKLSKEYDYLELEIESLEILKQIYAKSKNLIKEKEITDKLYQIERLRYNKLVDIKINELQKLYEKEIQERELEKLKTTEKINKLEIENSIKIKRYMFITISIVVIIFIVNIVSLNKLRHRNQ